MSDVTLSALASDIRAGSPGHAALHNEERLRISRLLLRTGGPRVVYADDYSSLNAAYAALPVAGGNVVLGAGKYTLTETLILRANTSITGLGRTLSSIAYAGGVMFTTQSTSVANVTFAHLGITATGGTMFAPRAEDSVSRWYIHDCELNQTHTASSIFAKLDSYERMMFERCNMRLAPTHTAPGFALTGAGNINQVFWRDCSCWYGGPNVFWFDIQNTHPDNYAYCPVFDNMLFEQTEGGLIRLLSVAQARLNDIHLYDQLVTGEDLIYIGKHADSNKSYCTTVTNYGRYGGRLGVGKHDINIQDASYTTLIGCYSAPFASHSINVSEKASNTQQINSPSAMPVA